MEIERIPLKILAIGYSVRHIVCSGSRAGYEMYAADAFGDIDTRRCATRYFPLNPLQLHADVKHLKAEIEEADGIIIGSGFESADFGFLAVKDRKKIVGNTPEKTREVSNKAWLSSRLDDLGIPHPLSYTGREIAEGKEKAKLKDFHYPVVAKPVYGGGGTANFFCIDEKELIRWAKLFPEFLFQEYINGTHASVSLISTEHEAISVSVNEQLIGLDSVYAPGPFAYCGNISPFVTKSSERMCEIAEFLTTELGLVGSNGIDFVVTDDLPFVIEVNPRFQGSLDTVELSTGLNLNLVDASMKAVRGEGDLLVEQVEAKRYAAKTIVFARQEGVVRGNLDRDVQGIVDIPEKGRIVKQGEPIATGIGIGDSRAEAVAEAMSNAERIKAGVMYKKINSCYKIF
ncbi:MAG: ATP-grasp domain-containing protein [Euryarchaeota archaeon]|nr:ATP-grasp domain-containing protein [Euryarchaeota archaeon]